MSEWTDVDYAQAAIDMLPEDVEEIKEFLKRQGVRNSKINSSNICHTCPIAQWVGKWTDAPVDVGYSHIYECRPDENVLLVRMPRHVEQFILKYGEGL